jgi:hypothetical protein
MPDRNPHVVFFVEQSLEGETIFTRRLWTKLHAKADMKLVTAQELENQVAKMALHLGWQKH